MPPHGLLNLNKPAGMTSRRAVDFAERLVRPMKLGHAGTLDPLASGVLVVCVGAATRLIEYVQHMQKSYVATFLLGRQSPTEDIDGDVVDLENPPIPSMEEILSRAETLTGRIQQRPPAYSAVKVRGRRAYALARAGNEVELKARWVMVHRLDVARYEYPELEMEIECGSGTYVRSLGRDLAALLGTAAVMSRLVRTAIGPFSVDQGVDPRDLDKTSWAGHLLPSLRAVETLPRVELTGDEVTAIRSGRSIPRPPPGDSAEIAAVDQAGHLVAILVRRGPGLLGPTRNLPPND